MKLLISPGRIRGTYLFSLAEKLPFPHLFNTPATTASRKKVHVPIAGSFIPMRDIRESTTQFSQVKGANRAHNTLLLGPQERKRRRVEG
jgi:hypothetical protein